MCRAKGKLQGVQVLDKVSPRSFVLGPSSMNTMKKRIHVNQHNIKHNQKHNTNKPVITVKTYKSNTYGHSVDIKGPSKVIYSPKKPLSCGAKVWVETEAEVEII